MFGTTTTANDILTRNIMIGVIVVIGLLAAFSIVRFIINKKKHASRKVRKLFVTLLSIAMAVLIAVNYLVYRYNNVIGIYLSRFTSQNQAMKDSVAASKTAVEDIVDEGIVMLENKNNVLPLSTKNVNVFGIASVDMKYSNSAGTKSGDLKDVVTLDQGLKNAGFNVNSELTNFYSSHVPKKAGDSIFSLTGPSCEIDEVPVSEYSDSLIANAKKFSDVAIVVISRVGGEGGDVKMDMTGVKGGDKGKHYLELQSVEISMIDMVKKNFDKVVVLLNTVDSMEAGFVQDEGIDAALWVGLPGDTGCNSIGKVLSGKVNPSGHLVDTWAYDATSAPSYYNTGDFTFSNTAHKTKNSFTQAEETAYYKYLDYDEGIYVGYRYYETRWIDNKTGKCDEQAYDAAVQYPFGYGLSYTNFKQEITDYTTDNGTITMKVKVTNTGKAAGKDVAQVYYTAPYNVGGIEKSQVVLAAFGKTSMLEPNASETLTLSFPIEDMASYDYINQKAYVLDKGTYEIKLMKDAHDVIDSRTYNVDNTVAYNGDNKRSNDKTAATNQFDDVTYGNGITYVSRSDWEGTLPTKRIESKEATEKQIAAISDLNTTYDSNIKDITYTKHGLTLKDVVGLDYNDPKWSQLLEQISVEEMNDLIAFGGWNTHAVASVNAPTSECVDGPSGLDNYVSGMKGTDYCNEVVIASTWNVDLAKEYGEKFGNEAVNFGYDGLYAPGINIHRSPFGGRNFEYFSEDGFLSGKLAAAVTKGMSSKGVFVHLKHYALNDQETNRQGVCVFANEQAIREIYLKPFEIAIKEGGATGIMGAFNRVGTRWAGADYALDTTVLRNEWGFHGTVITDYFIGGYFNPDQAVQAGTNLMESTTGAFVTKATTDTPGGRQALREMTHGILYTIVNSNAMNPNPKIGITWWPYMVVGIDVVFVAAIAYALLRITSRKKDAEVNSEAHTL